MSLKLYDITGRLVKNIYSGVRERGYYRVDVDAKDTESSSGPPLQTGIYFIKFAACDYNATEKLILIR